MDLGINGVKLLVTAGAAGIRLSIASALNTKGAKVHV
jgi:short-subunit dehydrogenase involved in D-alanine esterification of teichoic acids